MPTKKSGVRLNYRTFK